VPILGDCRSAMNTGGRVLIIEMMLPDGDTPHPRQNLRHTDARGNGRGESGRNRNAARCSAKRDYALHELCPPNHP
jgi:hypothetical protein